MSKRLVGSLVMAPAELHPAFLPPATRKAALGAKVYDELTPKTAARLMESKLGKFVHPLRGVGFTASRVTTGPNGTVTLSGRTAAGKTASVTTANPKTAFMPTWAIKLATACKLAWASDFTGSIRSLLEQRGFPVDPNMDWDRVLASLFTKAGIQGDVELQEAIQNALFTALLVRDGLSRFDPKKGGDDLPLDQKLSAYIYQLFEWQAYGHGEAGSKARMEYTMPSIDAPVGEDEAAGTFADQVPDPEDMTPEDYAFQAADITTLAEFRKRFKEYVNRTRSGRQPALIMTLFDIIVASRNGKGILPEWEQATSTGVGNMRKVLRYMKDSLIQFVESRKAPNSRLTEILNEIRSRAVGVSGVSDKDVEGFMDDDEPGPKAEIMDEDEEEPAPMPKQSSVNIMAAPDFIAALVATVRAIRKEAAAKVIDQSMLYLRMQPSVTKGPRFMELSFYSPSRKAMPPTGTYRIEVGDWSTDKGLNERHVKDQLATFVIPHLRGDAIDADQDVLEKIIRRLRSIVWENAVAYFEVPLADKPSWRNVVKMDIQTIQDTKVVLQDKQNGTAMVASTKPWMGNKAMRKNAVQPGGLMDTPFYHKQKKDRAEAATQMGIQVGGFINLYDWYPDIWAEVLDTFPSSGDLGPSVTYCRYEKDGTPNRQHRGQDHTYGYGVRKYEPTMAPAWGRLVSKKDGLYRDGQKVVPPAKQARSLSSEQNLTPAEQVDFAPYPDKTAGVVPFDRTPGPKCPDCGKPSEGFAGSGAMRCEACRKRDDLQEHRERNPHLYPEHKDAADANAARPDDPKPQPAAKQLGSQVFDPELHDPEAELSITHMSDHLKTQGVSDTAENMQAAVEGFNEARDAHHKEASMTKKFAALKRIAQENPEGVDQAIGTLIDKLQAQIDNLTTMRENLGGGPAPEGGEVVEGAPAPAAPVPGAPATIEARLAGLKRVAADAPDQIEEAIGEFYQGIDEVLALTENLADNLDITLPTAAPEEGSDEPVGEEVEEPADGPEVPADEPEAAVVGE